MEKKSKTSIIYWSIVAVGLVVLLFVGGLLGYFVAYNQYRLTPYEQRVMEIFSYIKENWLYSAEYEDVDKVIADLMLSGLNDSDDDPFMGYALSEEEMGTETDYSNKLSLGLSLSATANGLLVSKVEFGPSYGKININDYIVSFSNTGYKNGQEIKVEECADGLTFMQELQACLATPNISTTFTFGLKDKEPVQVTLGGYTTNPFYIMKDVVDGENHDVVVKVSTFLVDPTSYVKDYLNKTISENGNIDTLVIDLTHNGGGVINYARNLMELFADQGSFLYNMIDTNNTTTYYQERNPDFGRNKIADIKILMDGSTASASELFACALAGNNRAELYGTTSYGKGIGQSVISFKDGATFKFTTLYTTSPKTENGVVNQDFTYNGVGLNPTDFGGEELTGIYTQYSGITNTPSSLDTNTLYQQKFIMYYPQITGDSTQYSDYQEYLYHYCEIKGIDTNIDSSKPWKGITTSQKMCDSINTDLINLYLQYQNANYDYLIK